MSSSMLAASLPHRLEAERAAIADSFLGVTTWQAVCSRFGIDYAALLHKRDAS